MRRQSIPLAVICLGILMDSPYTCKAQQSMFRFPIEGDRTPSGIFDREFTDAVLGNSRYCGFHLGVDVGANRAGTSVYPMTRGTVKVARMIEGLGYAVVIEHPLPSGDPAGQFVTAVYYHMKAPGRLLVFDETVEPTSLIGTVSDRSEDYGGTAPHLHFGIRSGMYQTCDIRTGKWFYPGYTNIYKDAINCAGGTLECNSHDPRHEQIKTEWFPPLEFVISRENAGQPPCALFPGGFVPFSTVFYVSAPNAAGDRLVVGSITISGPGNAYANVLSLPLPNTANQNFCGTVQLGPGISVPAYVPTAEERQGRYPGFAGLLLDPAAGYAPFPSSGSTAIIPVSRIGSIFAWRIPPQ